MQRHTGPDQFTLATLSLVLAAVLWILIFLVRPLDFWVMLTISTLILLLIAIRVNRSKLSVPTHPRLVIIGIITALLMYGLFYVGFQVTRANPVFSQGVGQVYSFKSTTPSLLIGILLIFPISPSEEVYWRGLIQRRFAERLGAWPGFVTASAAYSLVHLPTLNPPLILTALIGGLVWGFLYKKTGSLIPGISSHVLFDLMIFVIAPFA